MQRAIFQTATNTQIQTRASRVLPGHETGVEEAAINDDIYHDESSLPRLVLSVLGNVMGGTLLIGLLYILPLVVAKLLG